MDRLEPRVTLRYEHQLSTLLGPDHVTHLSTDENPTTLVQGGVVAPPPSVSNNLCLSIRAVVAVHRLSWPPSRFLRQDVGVGATGVFAGKCSSTCVQRGRVTTNVMVRDLDLPVLNATDSRRLEVVVDGLPLFGGSQLAVDTTLDSDGSPHRGAADTDGVVFPQASRRKELRYQDGGSRQSRASCHVGLGGWRQVVTRDAPSLLN